MASEEDSLANYVPRLQQPEAPEARIPRVQLPPQGDSLANFVPRLQTEQPEEPIAPEPNAGLSKLQRYGLHGIAEVAQIPGILGSLGGLARAGWDYMTDPEVNSFTEAMTDPHYRYWIGELVEAEKKGDTQRMADIMNVLPRNLDSTLRGGIRFGLDWYNIGTKAANEVSERVFNEPFTREMGEIPWDEEAAGIALSAFVGVPMKAGTLPSQLITNQMLQRGVRVAEVLTPVTLPLTRQNIVANAIGGIAVNDVLRGIHGESGVTKTIAQLATPEESVVAAAPPGPATDDELPILAAGMPEDDGSMPLSQKIALGLGVIGIAGYALRGKYRSQSAVKRYVEAGRMHGQGGPESEVTTETARAFVNARATQGTGLESMLRSYQSDDVADAFADSLSTAVRSGGEAGVRLFADTGQLPNSGIVSVPLGDLFNRASVLTPDQRNILAEGSTAYSVRADRRVNPGRTVAEDWTDADVQMRIDALDADPIAKRVYDDVQRVYSDLADYRYRMGDIDSATRQEWTRKWGGAYMPNRQVRDEIFGTTKPLWRRAVERVMDSPATQRLMGTRLPRDTARGDVGVNVFDADIFDTLDAYANHHIKRVMNNNARRDYIDAMGYTDKTLNQPNVRGATNRMAGGKRIERMPTNTVPPHWYQTNDPRPDVKRNVVRVKRNGKDEFYEFGDSFVARELEFAPHATWKIVNGARRLWQQGTTGILNPARAPLAAIWDTSIGALTRKPQRAMGYLDELVLRASGGRYNFRTFDPTAFLWNVEGMGRALGAQALREGQRFIQQGLVDGSSWFASFAQTALGQRKLEQWSRDLWNLYHTTNYYQMHAHGFSNTSWLTDASAIGAKIINSEAARQMPTNNIGHRIFHNEVAMPAMDLLRVYQVLMDSVHNSAKYAYFSRNLAIQEHVKGRPLTSKEVTQLTREARELAGDMTRHVDFGDRANKMVSSVPYANVAFQSLFHLGRAATRDADSFANFTLSGALMGSAFIGGKYILQEMGAGDWYWNEMPTWQRTTSLVVPHPDAYLRWHEDPENYEFKPDDALIMQLPPELMPGISMMDYMADEIFSLEMTRARLEGGPVDDLKETVLNMLGFATPPALQATVSMGQTVAEQVAGRDLPTVRIDMQRALKEADITAALQINEATRLAGIEGNTVHANTYMSDNMHDTLSATFGVFGRMLGSMAEAYGQNRDVTDDPKVIGAFGEITGNTPVREAQEQLSSRVVGSSLWTGYNKRYLSSPRSDAVHDRMQQVEGVLRQAGVELGGVPGQVSRPGLSDILFQRDASNIARRVADPVAREMVGTTYQFFRRSPIVNHHMGRVNALRREYDAVRGNYRMPHHTKQQRLNDVVQELQGHYEVLAQHGEQYESTMRDRFGDEWTVEAMVEYIKDATTVQPTAGPVPP